MLNITNFTENLGSSSYHFVDGKTIMCYVYCLIFIVGFVGNIWVFIIISRNHQTKAVTNIFIVNLALADLFLILLLPLIVAITVIGEWVFGMVVCKLYFLCDGINKFASIMFLVLLSVDRYLAVCHPLRSRSIRTFRVAFALVAGSWTLVIVNMIPVLLSATLLTMVDEFNSTRSIQCSIYSDLPTSLVSRKAFTFYTFSISYLVPLLMIWSFYLLILYRLRRQQNLFNNQASSNAQGVYRASTTFARRRRTSRRISIMVLTIVISYTVCWAPYWIVQLTLELLSPEALVSYGQLFTLFSLSAYALQFMNSAINPFLYVLGTNSLRCECTGDTHHAQHEHHNVDESPVDPHPHQERIYDPNRLAPNNNFEGSNRSKRRTIPNVLSIIEDNEEEL